MHTAERYSGVFTEIEESPRFARASKYRIRLGRPWIPEVCIALGLRGELSGHAGSELTMMTMNGHLLAFEVDGSVFGTDINMFGLERPVMIFLALIGVGGLTAFALTRNPAFLGPALVLPFPRTLWRDLAVKDAARKLPGVIIVKRPQYSGDDFGSHF